MEAPANRARPWQALVATMALVTMVIALGYQSNSSDRVALQEDPYLAEMETLQKHERVGNTYYPALSDADDVFAGQQAGDDDGVDAGMPAG